MKPKLTVIVWFVGVGIAAMIANNNCAFLWFWIGLIGGLIWTFFLIAITKKSELKENSWGKFYQRTR